MSEKHQKKKKVWLLCEVAERGSNQEPSCCEATVLSTRYWTSLNALL